MPRIDFSSAVFVLASAAATNAISLSDFAPKSTNLPATCNAAYTSTILGCTTKDFAAGNQCSVACLNGLVAINAIIQTSCKDVDAGETSMIGLFLEGRGIQVLCSVAVVTKTTGVIPLPASQSVGQITMTLSSPGLSSATSLTETSAVTHSTATSSTAILQPAMSAKSGSSTSSKSTSTTALATAQSAGDQNPSSPNCSKRPASEGSPFDAFWDQECGQMNLSSSMEARSFFALMISATAIFLLLWR
jgi:hypothetical protein